MEHSKNTFTKFATIFLELAIDRPLLYGIPAELIADIKIGMQVKVSVRGKQRIGYVFQINELIPHFQVLPITELISTEEILTEELFELAHWMCKYYGAPLGRVLKGMLPASIRRVVQAKEQYCVTMAHSKSIIREKCIELRGENHAQATVLECLLKEKKGIFLTELLEKLQISKSPIDSLVKKGLIHLAKVQLDRSPLSNEEYFKTFPKQLNQEQQTALNAIVAAMQQKKFETHLIFGITGSGKTEIYLQSIEKALTMNLGTLMLVPEIALTTQTIERFRARFDKGIAILHHRLSQGERRDEWHRIKKGEARIVIGARSALFSPIQNLGLIILDEEHDPAYKQTDEEPCYHARDVAVMRGKLSNAVVVLGTATPSLESYYNVQKGKYTLSKLSTRASSFQLPKVTVIDMKKEFEKARGYTSFSEPLIDGIKKRLETGEQTILFLNRRGYHTSLSCQGCGYLFSCPNCDLALTFHFGEKVLACHLCNFHLTPPLSCTQCKHSDTLKYKGVGTEQIERALYALFPHVRTLRMDGDTTRHKGSHEKLFRAFGTGKADILIGTQMVTKGLHFPSVTLVAILNADSSLQIPDFRAQEKTFQLMTQVAGRSGRGHLPGEVLIQTLMPEHETIQLAAKQDFESFYESEIKARKEFCFPPFCHLIKFTFSGEEEKLTEKLATQFRQMLIQRLGKGYITYPLVPSGHPKVKNHYRFQFLIKTLQVYAIHSCIREIEQLIPFPKGIRVHVDVDPLSTFF